MRAASHEQLHGTAAVVALHADGKARNLTRYQLRGGEDTVRAPPFAHWVYTKGRLSTIAVRRFFVVGCSAKVSHAKAAMATNRIICGCFISITSLNQGFDARYATPTTAPRAPSSRRKSRSLTPPGRGCPALPSGCGAFNFRRSVSAS